MGEVRRKLKHLAIRRNINRHAKVKKLVARLSTADTREREKILEKLRRIAPFNPVLAGK
ncbi:MAG: hypothetical protein PHQ40_19430 [Anaerolineaceae bacterium]|nr:hypothetical protein [Anaerolineaceae bacterium]